MATPSTKTELLKTQAMELIKSYTEYDGQGRPEYIYTAHTNAADGDACTVVQYEYVDATTANVSKMKESYSTWDSDWDI